MRSVLIAATALLALAGPAQAAAFTTPIDSAGDAAHCFKNGGQPTFADGKWDKCIVPDMGKPRTPISLPVHTVADAALCSLGGGKVTMAHGDWDTCIIP
jgi:hypothetical protein